MNYHNDSTIAFGPHGHDRICVAAGADHRYLTHMLRFRGDKAETALANFFASGIFGLGQKLGPILWQFPPNFPFAKEMFEAILRSATRNASFQRQRVGAPSAMCFATSTTIKRRKRLLMPIG